MTAKAVLCSVIIADPCTCKLRLQSPPAHDACFDLARSLTHLPHHTDLSPPTGHFSHRSSSSRAQLAAFLSRCPGQISIEHAREVLLEYLLSQEAKYAASGTSSHLRSASLPSELMNGPVTPTSAVGSGGGGAGRGGKGTLSSAMFEEIAGKLKDVENSVRLHARVVVATMRITEEADIPVLPVPARSTLATSPVPDPVPSTLPLHTDNFRTSVSASTPPTSRRGTRAEDVRQAQVAG
jgi:hypothetical protein